MQGPASTDRTQSLPQPSSYVAAVIGKEGNWEHLPRSSHYPQNTNVEEKLVALLEEKNVAAIDGIKITFEISPNNLIKNIKIYYLKIMVAKVDVLYQKNRGGENYFYLSEFFLGVRYEDRKEFKSSLRTNTNPKRSIVGYTMDIVLCTCQATFDVIMPEELSARLEVDDSWDTDTRSTYADSDILMERDTAREAYIKSRTGDGRPLRNYTDDMLERVSERIKLNGWYGMWGFKMDEYNTSVYVDITHSGSPSYIPLNACMG